MKKKIVIFGSSGHAKVVIDLVEKENKYLIVGLIDKMKPIGEKILDYEIIGQDQDLPKIIKKYRLAGGIIAIGDNWVRKKIHDTIKLISPNFIFINAIHPNAQVARQVRIGEGTVIMAGSIISTSSVVGKHCILNTNSSLDHDCSMDDFSSLAPNATTGGNVKIGKFSAISLGANIIHGISIEEHTVIGAGSLVLKDVPSFTVMYGSPAEIIRKRKIGEKYL